MNRDIIHLYNRASFGINPKEYLEIENLSIGEAVEQMFQKAKSYRKSLRLLDDPRPRKGDVSNLRILLKALKSKEDLENLNLEWLKMMAEGESSLTERMTLFWHDHFATHVKFGILMQDQNNTLRKNALGSFRKMLHDIAKDPAMILYLNNQQNKKKSPNENFAREVMELFTLGQGKGYTEKDIKEAARCFTGWHINKRGLFEFNSKQHDFGEKTIFGKTGDFDGADVLDMLLDQKQCAKYICGKIYEYFVSETRDEAIIDALADEFFNSDYNIAHLMKLIFTSSWFYSDKNIGMKIKSPVDLIVQYMKVLKMKPQDPRMQIRLQNTLGQVLFFPPNVAGWKGGKAWIDSSSLPLRMRLPSIFFGQEIEIGISSELSMEKADYSKRNNRMQRFKAKAQWSDMYDFMLSKNAEVEDVLDFLISLGKDKVDSSSITSELEKMTFNNKKDRAKWAVTRVMALPEFQLA